MIPSQAATATTASVRNSVIGAAPRARRRSRREDSRRPRGATRLTGPGRDGRVRGVPPRAHVKPSRSDRGRNVAIDAVIRGLRRTASTWNPTALAVIADREGDPFRVLIACILSLRTQDTTTGPAADRLFAEAATPESMLRLTPRRIERLIYPVGFYCKKCLVIIVVCIVLSTQYVRLVA